MVLAVAVLASATGVMGQVSSQEKDPQYYHFLMRNCPGKNLNVTLKDGKKLSGKCEAQLVDRVQISREGVTYDIPYTDIAKMNRRRSWVSKCFDKVKGPVEAAYFFIYLVVALSTSSEKEPW